MKIPDKWYVKRNKETMGEVNKYFSHLFEMTFTADGRWYDVLAETGKRGYVDHDFLHFPKYGKRVKSLLPQVGYEEISYDAFLKHIVNKEKQTNMEKSIVGKKIKVNPNAKLGASRYIGQIGEVTVDYGKSITAKFSNGESVALGGPNRTTFLNEFTVVDDEPKGELVGYTLLKDTPDVPANTVGKIKDNKVTFISKDVYFNNNEGITPESMYSEKFCNNKPEWFSPIYEEEIEIAGYTLNASSEGVSFGCKYFSIEELKAYSRLLVITNSTITVEGTKITVELLNKIISKIEKENV